MVDKDIDDMLAELMGASITPEIFISKVAEIVDMHTQTLRQYDRVGIVKPSKDKSPTRRYSQRDIVLLKEAKRLSSIGINKVGIKHILDLRKEIIDLKIEIDNLKLKIKNAKHIFESDIKGHTIINKKVKPASKIEIHRIEWQ